MKYNKPEVNTLGLLNRTEVGNTKCNKPEIAALGPAIKNIEHSQEDKRIQTLRDSYVPFFYDATPCAYEADE